MFEQRFVSGPGGDPREQFECETHYAVQRLIQLMDSEDERVAVVACKSILDRGVGKPGLVKEEKDDLESRIANMTREGRLARMRELLARMRELLEPMREYLHEFEAEAEATTIEVGAVETERPQRRRASTT